MKRKIAVFANGWSHEYMELVLEGIRKCAYEEKVDIFAFVNFSSGAEEKPDNIGEKSIFYLPDLKNFDGAILLGNTLNLESEREYLTESVKKSKIPAISLEYELPGIPYLGTDNYSGFYELVKHILQEHHTKEFLYIGGPAENSENKTRMQATKDALAEAGIELNESVWMQAGLIMRLMKKCWVG